jgi:hypothetical protein
VNGIEADRFDPNVPSTREQMALMLLRAWSNEVGSLEGLDDLTSFRNAELVNEWALDAIRVSVDRGWLQGKAPGVLDPSATATRAESAQMLMNVLDDI